MAREGCCNMAPSFYTERKIIRQKFICKVTAFLFLFLVLLLIFDSRGGGGRGTATTTSTIQTIRSVAHDVTHTSSRSLLSFDNSSADDVTCTYSSGAVEEFPTDLFTQKEREKGAILLHIITLCYTFGLLAVVCDDYFVLSLYHICSRLNLDKDVAGATFMAVGSSAPTLFISIVSIFLTEGAGDVGLGTVVGSTIFNTLFITGVCSMAISAPMNISCWPLLRDSFVYTIGTLTLVVVVKDRVVHWWEASFFIAIYLFYILIMFFNKPLGDFFTSLAETCCGSCGMITMDDNDTLFDFTQSNEHLTKGEKGAVKPEKVEPPPPKPPPPPTTIPPIQHEDLLDGKNAELTRYEYKQNSPFQLPDGILHKVIWFLGFPVMILFYITIPPCCKEKWSEWYLVTFIMSVLWMGGLSYVLVWMVCIIGETFSIPDCIMGMTFLAAGSSIPDVMASVIVIRQGSADMALSNAIGSNVFDMLCLGVPWMLKTTLMNPGTFIQIESQSIMVSALLLIASIVFLVVAIHLNDWKVDKKLGVMFLTVYIVFITLATLLEFLACPCQLVEIIPI